jgi:hypothetical protein
MNIFFAGSLNDITHAGFQLQDFEEPNPRRVPGETADPPNADEVEDGNVFDADEDDEFEDEAEDDEDDAEKPS